MVILNAHYLKNQSVNEQKRTVLERYVNSSRKVAEMQFQSTNISLFHMYRVHLPLPKLYSVVLISSNVERNIRNEVDKTFVRTK